MKYSKERKESVLRKTTPPHNRLISQLANEEGISEPTLYNWRNEARRKGILLPDGDSSPEGLTARDKFAAVIETATLNEKETAEYCRRKGIYPDQLRIWSKACEAAKDWGRQTDIKLKSEQKTNRKRIKDLEKELQRKEKALLKLLLCWCCKKRYRRSGRNPTDE